MSLQSRVRAACAGVGLLLLVSTVQGQARVESSVAFDGAQGANPSSPAGGKITATGSYTLEKGATFVSVLFKYRLQGDQGWTVAVANNTPPGSWDKTVTGLAAGTYETHAVLRVSLNGNPVDYSTADVRTVTVAAP